MGVYSYPLPAAAAEPAACATPVALVVFHRPAQLAPDPRAAVNADRTERAMPPSVTLEMAIGFTLYMVKAVLSGRGDEVIDLTRPICSVRGNLDATSLQAFALASIGGGR